jgi:hypothetical protein
MLAENGFCVGELGFRLPLLPNARSKNKALRVIKQIMSVSQ